MRRWGWVGAAFCVAACGKRDSNAASAPPSVSGKLSVTMPSAATPAAVDLDIVVKGEKVVPHGYIARLDQPDTKITDVSYTADGNGRWEVRTGPAHILYALKDTARKTYSVAATFEQLENPIHPEAYGVFIGGTSLDKAAQRRYTYFIVRGDGKYMVKVRDQGPTRTVTDWTANPAIPRQNASGKGVYGIRIDVNGKSAKVSVNGRPVTVISAAQGPLDGIAGIRINHNLHLMVTPLGVIH